MRIVHIAPNAPYTDYWGYQDNLLPKYQAKLGHEVWFFAINIKWENNQQIECACDEYTLADGVHVKRFATKKYPIRIVSHMVAKMDVYESLCRIRPDFIFYHGLTSITIFQTIKYVKKINPKCHIVQDNHLDYNIGLKFDSLKLRLVRSYYRGLNHISQKNVTKVYGVTPWRKTYAEDYFHISKSKTDVLIMGADDEKIDFKHRKEIRKDIRNDYGISNDEFLIITGGKIDKKKKIDLLMQAVKGKEKVKLIVFGKANADFEEEFAQAVNDNVIYIGWVKSDQVYNYFFAADLVIFPGQHSVLWEQACASKIPCVFEKWDGMEHVDNGGNSIFVSDITVNLLSRTIDSLLFTEKYYCMKAVAESEKTDIYLYSNIAKKSVECAKP